MAFLRFRFLAVFAVLLFVFTGPALADYAEGKRAYESEDWFNAIRILRPLAEDGDDRALVLLGNMYNDGKGVEQNHAAALEHYKRALVNGNNNAMLAIATMYVEGFGVEKDLPTAFDWFQKSAEAGNPAAQFMVASFYLNGHPDLKNLKADPVKSYSWYRIAARQDKMPDIAKTAREFAKRLTVQLSPDQILNGEKAADAYFASLKTKAPTSSQPQQDTAP